MNIRAFLLLILLSCGLATPVSAADEEETSSAKKHQEGEEEEEEEKPETGGKFLPVPIIITEPAVGEGLGAMLVYFHGAPDKDAPKITSAQKLSRADRKQTPPPTATGVFAAYTNNDTSGFGIGHSRTFREDRWRLTALLADAKVNATYYVSDRPFDFSLAGTVVFAKIKRRFGNSNVFLGFGTSLLDADITFPIDPEFTEEPIVPGVGFKDIGASISIIYDSRDDTMMPSSGQFAELASWHYDEGLGGDYDYTKTDLKFNSFHKLGKKFVLGWRIEGAISAGDPPFYAAPYVKLRGIPALRYQGKSAGAVEIELRYQFAKRWAVLGFTGEGWTDERDLADETADDIDAFGFGVRWLALPTKNVWVGVDLARGPEEDAFYIQLVHPW